MPIPRPKILTAVTVPSGGWDLDFIITNAVSLDTSLTATISAGTYFMAWDGQTDDLIHEVTKQMEVAITASGFDANRYPMVALTSDHKVKFSFQGSGWAGSPAHDVELTWTTSHADLAKALGVDASADDQSTGADNPSFEMDHQHAYGWYADEDGQLENLPVHDFHEVEFSQGLTFAGQMRTVKWADRYTSELILSYLSRAKMNSNGVAYGATPVYPYTYNKALECWWQEARQGTRFRVYRDERWDRDPPAGAIDSGGVTASNATTVTDSSKAWATDPQSYKDMLCRVLRPFSSAGNGEGRFRIASHTATVLTSYDQTRDGTNWAFVAGAPRFAIHDGRYETYVLDLHKMDRWEPEELGQIDRYRMVIPLRRYVA